MSISVDLGSVTSSTIRGFSSADVLLAGRQHFVRANMNVNTPLRVLVQMSFTEIIGLCLTCKLITKFKCSEKHSNEINFHKFYS